MIDPATLMADWPRLILAAVLPALLLLATVFVLLVFVGVGKLARRQ